MNKLAYKFLLITVAIVFISGCEKDKPQGFYNPDAEYNPAPVITAIEPAESALAGIVRITIAGENFSPIPEYNSVYFGKTKAVMLEAAATRLIVKSPAIPIDSAKMDVELKVGVVGALPFSNVLNYRLVRAIEEFIVYESTGKPYVLDCDRDENLYVVTGDKTIEKISPNKEKTQYGTTAITIPSATKIGPEGYLYIARKTKDIYRVPPGGGVAVKWGTAPNRVDDFDFSPTGVMYAGGKGDNLYILNPDGTGANVADYPDTYIYTVRVFNGYVYVGGKINATNHYYIWRNQINSDTDLRQKEEYFDWSGTFDPDAAILSMTFAEDGDLYVGTDVSLAIIVVHADGTHEPLYQGLLAPSSNSLSWGNGEFLYVCRRSADTAVEPHKIIKINMLKKSAPYYGRP